MSIIKDNIVNDGHGSLNPQFLVVHSTANVGATAQNHANYWHTNPEGIKYAVHYVSDWMEALHTVQDDRKCWHVGNANYLSIGIEICEGTNAEEVRKGLEIAAQACREILDKHGWGIDKMVTHDYCTRTYGGSDHTDPIPYFNRWGITWEQFVDMVRGTSSAPVAPDKPAETQKPQQTGSGQIAVDGLWGKDTTSALQRALGTPVDGIVSGQDSTSINEANKGGLLYSSWTFGNGGSPMIRALQRKVGTKDDGYFGPNTCRALQRYLGTVVDGYVSKPSAMVKALQSRLNAGNF